ncbi:flagellar basal body-associated FliL family protein [Cellvibrio japonicus]|nr:flagellar basal body-associated FliL family protein [Cellvibrio japonicus]
MSSVNQHVQWDVAASVCYLEKVASNGEEMFMNLYVLRICMAIGLLLSSIMVPVWAAGGGDKIPEGINYIPVAPALIVNYGGPDSKTRYIKVELSIRAENAADTKTLMHHLPLIRDRLISIFSAQTEEALGSVEGKEKLRLEALAEINRVVHEIEYGADAATQHSIPANKPASDLLFNNFVVQR